MNITISDSLWNFEGLCLSASEMLWLLSDAVFSEKPLDAYYGNPRGINLPFPAPRHRKVIKIQFYGGRDGVYLCAYRGRKFWLLGNDHWIRLAGTLTQRVLAGEYRHLRDGEVRAFRCVFGYGNAAQLLIGLGIDLRERAAWQECVKSLKPRAGAAYEQQKGKEAE